MVERPLWEHQKKAISMAEKMPSLFLAMEMGTGKTRTTIEIIRRRFAGNKRVMRTLIVCPPIVCENWKREFGEFSKIDQKEILVLLGPGAKRAKKFYDSVLDTGKHSLSKGKIIITNYEAMQMDALYALFLEWQPEIMVCDESHRCKNHASVRAKRVVKLARGAQHKYLLTGTPILNSALDIFNQFLILDSGETFKDNFFAFRATYFEDENASWSSKPGHFPKYTPRINTYAELNRRMLAKSIRVIKSECLDLPPLVKEKIEVELSPEQVRMYAEMRDEYITYVEGLQESGEPAAVVAQLAITKALRLQQIVSGFAKTEYGEVHSIEKVPRLTVLKDLLEDLTPAHKVIVWAVFKENYVQIGKICKALGLEYAELHGEVGKDRVAMVDKFRNDPKCRVMIANQGAGGVGVNLTEASYSIYYSKNFSLEHELQSEARNYRGGSEMHQKVTRIDLVAKGTIDELITDALAAKQNIALQVLDWKDKL